MGCTPTLSLHALAQPVADFARDNPVVRLDMRQAHSQLGRHAHEGQIDMALGPPEIACRHQAPAYAFYSRAYGHPGIPHIPYG